MQRRNKYFNRIHKENLLRFWRGQCKYGIKHDISKSNRARLLTRISAARKEAA